MPTSPSHPQLPIHHISPSSISSAFSSTSSSSSSPPPTVPAACASLLSLHTSLPPNMPSNPCPPPPHSVSPVSVLPSASRASTSRFWNTVMSANGAIDSSPSPHPTTASSPSTPEVSAAVARGEWRGVTQREGNKREGDEVCKMNIPCVVCGVRFRKPGHLNMHWRSVHAGSADAVYPGNMMGVGSGGGSRVAAYGAAEGKKGGVSNAGSGGRAYGCPQCEARFRRGSDRNRHMRMVHAKIRPYKCKQCGSHFGRKSFLEAHVLTVHEKLRPFRCECGASFGQRSSLTRHARKIHGKEP